jgi:hypothetical protein
MMKLISHYSFLHDYVRMEGSGHFTIIDFLQLLRTTTGKDLFAGFLYKPRCCFIYITSISPLKESTSFPWAGEHNLYTSCVPAFDLARRQEGKDSFDER